MEERKDIFQTMEEVKRQLEKTKKQESQLRKLLFKPFNKTNKILNITIFLITLLVMCAFTWITMMMFGVGNGLDWATGIPKELSRSSFTTAQNIIVSMIGFIVGVKVGKNEGKRNDDFND